MPARSAGRGVTAAQRRVLERMAAGGESILQSDRLIWAFAGGDYLNARTCWSLVRRGYIAQRGSSYTAIEYTITDLGRAALSPAVGGGDAAG